jgi:hypothetical protein
MPLPGNKVHPEPVPAHSERGVKELLMKAYCLLASLAAIALSGCAVYPTPVAYTQPTVVTAPATTVAPAYVAPSGSAVIIR